MLTLGALANILEDFGNLVLEQGFLLQQGERQAVQNIAVFQQNLERLIVCLLQQGADLSVNLCRGRVGVVACRSAAATRGTVRCLRRRASRNQSQRSCRSR